MAASRAPVHFAPMKSKDSPRNEKPPDSQSPAPTALPSQAAIAVSPSRDKIATKFYSIHLAHSKSSGFTVKLISPSSVKLLTERAGTVTHVLHKIEDRLDGVYLHSGLNE
jgi:hypothetical protein